MNFNIDTKLYGWLQGFLAVFMFLAINQVVGRYCTVVLEVNPVIYSCTAFISCALILLAIGGSGPLARETMRSVDTWVYGSILMLSYIVGMILYNYITSTELTMLQKISVGASLIGSWFFIGRTPDKYQVIGAIIVTIGVIVVAIGVDGPHKGIVYFLSGLYGFAQAARVFTAELHRPHAKAASISSDPRAKARVIGFVMLVVSSLFLILTTLMALAQESMGQPFINGFPMLEEFMHAPSIFTGLLTGILLMAPLRVLEFSSSRIIKAENFMVILTFTTVATLFWEWISAPLTGLDIKTISENDVCAIVLITLGGLVISLTRKLKKTPKWHKYISYTSQDIERVDDSREIIANTLEHFKGDVTKSAEALGVDKGAIEAILMDEKKVLAFSADVLKNVARKYRRNVAASDSLTGLANRAGFMTALKGAAYEADTYSVIFIDLDKFKPINDTHGHDAGDFVLKGVGERLREMFPTNSVQTRLGGDEFCVLLLGKLKLEAEAMVTNIQKVVAEPFTFEGKEINVTASVGVASYPSCSTDPEELLKMADKGMYRGKNER